MTTRDAILAAALQVLEEGGSAQFSTRAVCAIAKVTAPTLYHHFGSADGLLSEAMAQVFQQFLASKRAAVKSSDPAIALRQGWDDYVRFAAKRPRLYAAAMGRILDGARIAAADQAQADLRRQVQAAADRGLLVFSVEQTIDLVWASANAAALLFVTALGRQSSPPKSKTVDAIRESAMQMLLRPQPEL